jgi:hypothetical protein
MVSQPLVVSLAREADDRRTRAVGELDRDRSDAAAGGRDDDDLAGLQIDRLD